MKRLWQTFAAWSALGLFWAGAPLLADPPFGEIEQYHGLQRVDGVNPPRQPHAKPLPAIEPDKITLVSGTDSGEVWTIVPSRPAASVAGSQAPGTVKDGVNAANAAYPRPSHAKAEVELVPPAAAKFEGAPPQESRARPSQAEPSFIVVNGPREEGRLNAVSSLVGTILTPLAVLAGIWIVVRYLQGRSGPLIRIEHVGGTYTAPVASAAPEQSEAPAPPRPPVEEASTAEVFELGPTFEEERLAREQQALQQEEGVLRQLFDDNVKLKAQLKEMHDEWSSQADLEPQSTDSAESPSERT